jgi:hypothetical protein
MTGCPRHLTGATFSQHGLIVYPGIDQKKARDAIPGKKSLAEVEKTRQEGIMKTDS